MSENSLGLKRLDYKGAKSTLCSGCGHDSITNNIISSLFLSSINPHKVVKLSGIGCSSKTPTYFLDKSFGFNSIHGRMAPCATGAKIANHTNNMIGISGDGDTASIGLGGFSHLLRRNLPMVYIVENNGVYGLTKGQFSATADVGSSQKSGELNPHAPIDLCALAIQLGCTFVARSFSGDSKQLVPLLQAAFKHKGTAVIDIISPCVTFANHEGSTKSYDAVKENKIALQELGFIAKEAEITADYDEGYNQTITLSDGSQLLLKKLDSKDHDVSNSAKALIKLNEAVENKELLTGLFYFKPGKDTFIDYLNLSDTPLSQLNEAVSRLKKEDFDSVMELFE